MWAAVLLFCFQKSKQRDEQVCSKTEPGHFSSHWFMFVIECVLCGWSPSWRTPCSAITAERLTSWTRSAFKGLEMVESSSPAEVIAHFCSFLKCYPKVKYHKLLGENCTLKTSGRVKSEVWGKKKKKTLTFTQHFERNQSAEYPNNGRTHGLPLGVSEE